MASVAVRREDDGLLGNTEMRGERVEQEDDDEEVERVESPAEKAGGKRVLMS